MLVQAWEREWERMSPLCALVPRWGLYIFALSDSQLPWEGRDLPQVVELESSCLWVSALPSERVPWSP